MNQPQGQQPPPATPPQGYMAQPPVYYAPQPQAPQASGNGTSALWLGAGGILAAVVLLAVLVAFLAPSCGNKQPQQQPPPITHQDPNVTVRMRVPNPIKAARERADKLERANKDLAEKLDKERKQRLADLKDAKKKLEDKLDELQKKLDGMKGDKVAQLKKDLADLKEKLAKKPKVVVRTRWRTKEKSGPSKTETALEKHLKEFKVLRDRIQSITSKPKATGKNPPPADGASN